MKALRILIFISAVFSCSMAFSQTVVPGRDNEFDKKYSPPPNSIFNKTNKKNNESSGSSEITIKNSIKFSPTMLARQKVGFFYERSITDGFSATFGLGKAFGRDFIEAVGMDAFTLEDYSSNTATPGSLLQGTYNSSSPFLSAGLRLYYSGETFDGGYVDLFYRHESTEYIIGNQLDGYRVEGSRIAEFKMNSFNFGFGFSGVSGNKGNITHDFFMSMGIRMYQYTKYDRLDVPTVTGSTETIYRYGGTSLTARVAPSVNICYSIGFGF